MKGAIQELQERRAALKESITEGRKHLEEIGREAEERFGKATALRVGREKIAAAHVSPQNEKSRAAAAKAQQACFTTMEFCKNLAEDCKNHGF